MSLQKFIMPLLLLILLILIVVGGRLFNGGWLDAEELALSVEHADPLVLVAFFFAAIVFTAFGLPRQLVAFVSGFVFGLWPGLLVSLLAATAGCAVAFFLSRKWLGVWVRNRYPTITRNIDLFVKDDAFGKIIVLRLQPLGTNLLTNLCAGVSAISATVFLTSSALGYIPQMMVFALTGAGLRVGSQLQLIVSALMFVVSVLLGVYLYRRHRIRIDDVEMPSGS